MNKNPSKFKGHHIELINDEWRFCESGDLVKNVWKKIPCYICDKKPTIEGHDNCLGTLPGVMNACCGHGKMDEAYVQFLDGSRLEGYSAKKVITGLKNKGLIQ